MAIGITRFFMTAVLPSLSSLSNGPVGTPSASSPEPEPAAMSEPEPVVAEPDPTSEPLPAGAEPLPEPEPVTAVVDEPEPPPVSAGFFVQATSDETARREARTTEKPNSRRVRPRTEAQGPASGTCGD